MAAGGRGAEMAEEIDALSARRDWAWRKENEG
jgi:hypothetical protein